MVLITDATKDLIEELNKRLEENCSDLKLTINKAPIGDIILCLNYEEECVSFLTLNDDYENFLSILSVTVDKYQRKGYNKFLTAVCIFLADTITDSKVIFLETHNKVIIHILEKYNYRKTKEDLSSRKSKEDLSSPPSRKSEKKFDYYLDIDKKNKKKAEEIINEWIDNKCVRVKKGGNKTRRNKQKRKSKKCKSKRL